jgi:small subunit ribosomal protein S8
MLTRVRNALRNGSPRVNVPASRMKAGVLEALVREGFIRGYQRIEDGKKAVLRVELKYGPDQERVIRKIERVSKPGRRVYAGYGRLKPVLNGQGIDILSTPKGVLSNRECRRQKVGGEVLCRVW